MKNIYLSNGFQGKNEWWRYLLVIIIVFAATQIGSIPFAIIATARAIKEGVELTTNNLTNYELLRIDPNLGLFLMLLPFAIGLLTLLLMIKPFHQRKILLTLTSRPRFNWSKFFFAALIWGSIILIEFIVDYLTNPSEYVLQFNAEKFIVLFMVALIFLSLQSSFEEVLFRGYFQQGLAVLSKNAWIPLLLTSALFGLMHGMNPEVEEYGYAIMLPQYTILGLFLGIITIMDEGLELAIGVHVINNVLGALLVTSDNSVLKTPAIFKAEIIDPVSSLYVLLISTVIFLFIMHRKYKWGSFKKLFYNVNRLQFDN